MSTVTLVALSCATGLARAQPPPPSPAEVRSALHGLEANAQADRDAAAAILRRAAERPGFGGDGSPWRRRLAAIRPGITEAELLRRTGAQSEGGVSGGGGTTATYRLDDFWSVTVVLDRESRVRSIGPPTRSLRSVWVAPPERFSGRWVTYFVNGAAAHEIEYAAGVYTRFTARYDNGQLTYVQTYVNGQIDGPETGYDRDGRRLYEIQRAMGRNVGTWRHWYPSGQRQSEQTYVDGALHGVSTHWREDGTRQLVQYYDHGRETGQAAWDEQGALLYAHGAAQADVRAP